LLSEQAATRVGVGRLGVIGMRTSERSPEGTESNFGGEKTPSLWLHISN
jgi:hypothetical protein